MLQNYLKIAWRNLLRNKTYSLIILSGLASGMTCALALWLYVQDELIFDRYHKQADRIVRVNIKVKWGDNEYRLGMASAPFGPALQHEYPEIQNSLRVKKGSQPFRSGDKALLVKDLICADSTLFSFFDYEFVEGTPAGALVDNQSVVLTEKLAMKLFGQTTGLIGKIVMVKDDIPFRVSGVVRNPPLNHHLTFDAILPYSNEAVSRVSLAKWDGYNTLTYLLLNKKEDAKNLTLKMPAFYKKYIAGVIGGDEDTKVTFAITFQPLTEIHLHSTHLIGEENGGRMSYVYIFSIVGLFILLIAIVNYINLATARSAGRAREIGVRKAVGSLWSQLIGQFMTEAMLMSSIASLSSILLLTMLLPLFNRISGKTLTIDFLNAGNLLAFAAFTVVIGLISGLYPALVLSRFRPAQVLKGTGGGNGEGGVFRQSLVVIQFFISMVMIAGTITVYRQLHFMQDRKLGFNQQQVVTIPLKSPSLQKNAAILKSSLLQSPLIMSAALTNGSIGDQLNNKTTFDFYNSGNEQSISAEYFYVDEDFADVLEIPIADGRGFSAALDQDSSQAVLINQSMMKRLGWKNYKAGVIELDGEKRPVTGVVHDFHLRSLHNQIEPLAMILKKGKAENLLVKIGTNHIPATLNHIKKIFTEVNKNQPFEYEFLDEAFAKQYRADDRKGRLFLVFSAVAIMIACLGLFGLAIFVAERRTKEIGVRKVLGASVASIVSLLSRDLLKLVMVSVVIAVPVCWYLMRFWLRDFAYKVDPEWWTFALAAGLAMLIAIVTVIFQCIKAALVNPVESLRAE